jgi:hypothetical protein
VQREGPRGADPRDIFNKWRVEYERHVERRSGESWVHYSAGGVDAIFELLD